MNASDILQIKGSTIVTIQPDQEVRLAISKLVQEGVGALVVVDQEEKLAGVLTERDILRASAHCFDCLKDLKVSDLMSVDVIIGLTDQSVDSLMCLMTDKHIRHLPIMEHGRLAGLLSIGDLVKAKARRAEVEIHYFKDYIADKYPG